MDKKILVFMGVGMLLASDVFADEVRISTYYPSPYGNYRDLESSADTRLATTAGNAVGVGIPTGIALDAKFQVVGDGNGMARLGGPTGCGGDYAGLSLNGQAFSACQNYNILSSPTDSTLYINRPVNRFIRFREANAVTDQMVIAPTTGNVGIGTSAPNFKLDVVGNTNTSGNLTAGGNATVTGTMKVGATTAPLATLDVNGGVKIGDHNGCDVNRVGVVRFSGGSLQYCEGASGAWINVGTYN